MSNFLKETKEAIKLSGHKVSDIVFIGSENGYSCSWSEFEKLADQEYYSGFGCAQVAADLKIIFSDGQTMWRSEYDGSEWWEYSTPFIIPKEIKPIKRVIGRYWPSLDELQDDTDNHHNPNINFNGDKR